MRERQGTLYECWYDLYRLSHTVSVAAASRQRELCGCRRATATDEAEYRREHTGKGRHGNRCIQYRTPNRTLHYETSTRKQYFALQPAHVPLLCSCCLLVSCPSTAQTTHTPDGVYYHFFLPPARIACFQAKRSRNGRDRAFKLNNMGTQPASRDYSLRPSGGTKYTIETVKINTRCILLLYQLHR